MATIAAHALEVIELNWISQFHDWRNFGNWMREHNEVPIGICVAYLVLIFSIQHLMKNRKPLELQRPLFWWNVLLAGFSVAGAICTVPQIAAVVWQHGISYDMCTTDSEAANPWVYIFCLSKIPELLDTVFIVLRKRPLIFLHYYHHVLTLLYCWDAWSQQIPNGGWFAAMNLVIHSLMYSYYAACARGVRFSNRTRLTITSLQILQMVLGLSIVLHNFFKCNTHPSNYIFGLVMYASYMVLFTKLFLDSYVFAKRPPKTQAKQQDRVKDEQSQDVPPSTVTTKKVN